MSMRTEDADSITTGSIWFCSSSWCISNTYVTKFHFTDERKFTCKKAILGGILMNETSFYYYFWFGFFEDKKWWITQMFQDGSIKNLIWRINVSPVEITIEHQGELRWWSPQVVSRNVNITTVDRHRLRLAGCPGDLKTMVSSPPSGGADWGLRAFL